MQVIKGGGSLFCVSYLQTRGKQKYYLSDKSYVNFDVQVYTTLCNINKLFIIQLPRSKQILFNAPWFHKKK